MVRYWVQWIGLLIVLGGAVLAGLWYVRPPVTPWQIAYTYHAEAGLHLNLLDVWTGTRTLLTDQHPTGGTMLWSADGAVLRFIYLVPQDLEHPQHQQLIQVERGTIQDLGPRDLRVAHWLSPDQQYKLVERLDPHLNVYVYTLLSRRYSSPILLWRSEQPMQIAWSAGSRFLAYGFMDLGNYTNIHVRDLLCTPGCPPHELYRVPGFGVSNLRWLESSHAMFFGPDLHNGVLTLALHQLDVEHRHHSVLWRLALQSYPVWLLEGPEAFVIENAYVQPVVQRLHVGIEQVTATLVSYPDHLGPLYGSVVAGAQGLYLPLGQTDEYTNKLYYLDNERGLMVPLLIDPQWIIAFQERPQP
jgi:hypothetical protein